MPKPERENGFASQETGEEGQEDNMKEMMSSVPETSASLSISHTPKKPLMPGIQFEVGEKSQLHFLPVSKSFFNRLSKIRLSGQNEK